MTVIVLKYVLCAVIGYALGNFSTGMWIGYKFGKTDIRTHGSGNPGTTNVLRTLGWLPSILTLLGDALKASLAALIGLWLIGPEGARLAGLFALIGRIWPVMYKFQGGKGIATAAGVLLVTDPMALLVLLIIQVLVIAVTKYMSLASIFSAVLYFVYALVRLPHTPITMICCGALSALLIFAHRSNISRLLAGTENRLDFSKYHLKNTPK